MTTNLRIKEVEITSSSSISISFTENLTYDLVPANVSIISDTNNVPDSLVLKVVVTGNILTITCQPLTEFAAYNIQLQSTIKNPFISTNGDAKISEDGVSNRYSIIGPIGPDNPVKNYLEAFYHNNIYNLTDPNTIISKYIQAISVNFSRVLYDIRQVKNENYLSFTVNDELQIRGEGPFDRLNEEAVYDIFRVGRAPANTLVPSNIVFDSFPTYPITLQKQTITEIITPSSTDTIGTFNINTLTFNLKNYPLTKVNSIVFTITTVNPVYTYDIPVLGYQLLSSRYDTDYASSYLLLKDNQVRLNEKILQDHNFSLDQILNITIQYEYKNLGKQIDSNSVNVFTTLQSIRETLPPIINIFSLAHAPITNLNNNIPTLSGVIFVDSNTGVPHPAFLSEIPFSLSALPSTPGIYSIDYATATVYVYGADSNNDGTGPFPPLATYYYRFTYTPEIDYVYDTDLIDIIALPNGNLINSNGTILFNFETVLIPGIDYIAESHVESLNERVGNNLTALNSLITLKSPITNVFQIYNETSGEIYTLDRWNDDVVYFKYNSPPRILNKISENSSFENIVNELLCIHSTLTNLSSQRIFVIYLSNNTIIASTQDGIASSFNTSLVFNNGIVFSNEKWYNKQLTLSQNLNSITNIGQYIVDYQNGIIYVSVSLTQDANIGTATYKKNNISPYYSHVVSVEDIYYQISPLNPKNKQFNYLSFGEGSIVPEGLDYSDESFLNKDTTTPYQYYNGSIGSFISSAFVPGVSNSVKFVRGIYEYNDLSNSINPLNFAQVSASNNYQISVSAINKQSFETVQFDGTHYFITLNENIPYVSSGITYTFSIIRTSDSKQLWNGSGTLVPGNPLKLVLPGINSPQTGDLVNVKYSFAIVPLERVVVDYNKGDFFIDYTYVADEILVSYEYGDNVIDFRKNTNLPSGTEYYVSYKAGALRDSLLKNFGTLVKVPDLDNFDLSLNRERYREALQAALSSFIQGPTISAVKNIGKIITHIEPEIIESAFEAWSLGNGLLFPSEVKTTGSFKLLPGHYGNGVLVNSPNQTIIMPVSSNLRLEEGTFETWVIPQWNGLDNDAELTFNITRDGYNINPSTIFIGASENHPVIVNNIFSLDKNKNVSGRPNINKDGIFIYYDNDISGNFKRWYVEIIDGYVNPTNHTYKFKISSTGKFYDVKSTPINNLSNMTIFTGTNSINFTITATAPINEGITFISDVEHYILDFGNDNSFNRLSIFKDVSGYLNFRVYDKNHVMYSVSADISAWKINSAHMVAASWKFNTRNERDEMHLFIDGFEVPNIIKYGQKLQPYLHEKFRTINPEEIVGLVNRDIIGSNDLVTTYGSPIVVSTINFSSYNIQIGDTIFIDEIGFLSTGYTITNINGQTLTLNDTMPLTLSNGRFSINKTQFSVSSDINITPNISVNTIHPFIQGSNLSTYSGSNIVSCPTNFTAAGVLPGFLLRINNVNFALTYNIIQVSGTSLMITDNSPINLTNVSYQIYSNIENEIPGKRALKPAYNISQDINFNNILTILNDVFANDLVLIRTLGFNNRNVKKQHYIWGDGYENILMTRLPAPISLDQVNVNKIILPNTFIGPSPNPGTPNYTLSGGIFTSIHLPIYQPTNLSIGRTLEVNISGNNTDFTTPATITINGITGATTVSETITFTNYGTLDFANLYNYVNWIQVSAKPINVLKPALSAEIKEKYSITHSENNEIVPIIRFSYYIAGGNSLQADGYDNMVTDGYNLFSYKDIGNYLIISSPAPVAGYYIITGISEDRHSVYIQSTLNSFAVPLSAFTGGIYQVLNVNSYRSGLQNGFFTFEKNNLPGQPFLLNKGFYELKYATYASIKFDPINDSLYFGSDFNGNNQVNAVIDESVIYSTMLTDTRIGEVISTNQRSITKDFNSLKALKPNENTLVLLDFDSFPFYNLAKFYTTQNDHIHFTSSTSVNDNFDQSVVILDKPIILSNDGILDARKQGTIEFWMNPLFDTANDPQERYYFDAYGAIIEEVVSVSNVSVKVSSSASSILSVILASGNDDTNYFAGGKLEIDTQKAIQEEGVSIGNSKVLVSRPILQVITVKIIGDFTGTDYFNNGSIGSDGKTIYLGSTLPTSNVPLIITYQTTDNKDITLDTQIIRLNKKLPAQNTKVIVKYLPKGFQGDRLSIFKDKFGFINFSIIASGINFSVRAPTYWSKNTWHRIKASYKFNGGIGQDEMRLFLDGYQYSNKLLGQGLMFGQTLLGAISIGNEYSLVGDITFKDPINNLFIGTDYSNAKPIFTTLNNMRISNISRSVYAPYGEPIDVNYSNNLSTVFPVTKDLYTTYLMNYNNLATINTIFSTLVDRANGSFDFTANIYDSFGIVSGSSAKVKEILENLINILKPANSKCYIKYIT